MYIQSIYDMHIYMYTCMHVCMYTCVTCVTCIHVCMSVLHVYMYIRKEYICCSAQTGQHEPCKGECCPVWALQQICWISLGNRHV